MLSCRGDSNMPGKRVRTSNFIFFRDETFGKVDPGPLREVQAESRLRSVVKRVLGLGAEVKILVRGHDDLLVYRAKCCNPIRGEEIIGYVTRGKGVAVHSKSCSNVQNLLYEADRRIEVEWADQREGQESYAVHLTVISADRPGLLAGISAAVSEVRSNILDLSARTDEERGIIDMTVELPDMKHLEKVVSSIRQLEGVYDVVRSSNAINSTTRVGK
jgi:GTP pyrophosphokinase